MSIASAESTDSRAVALRGNSIGLLTTAALTAAYMGPALSIYALFGPMTLTVGTGVGFVMLIGMIVTLFSAISFGMLAREMPSAGGVYTWTRSSLGNGVGLYLGLTTAMYYTICLIFPPIVFGQFFNELLQKLGVPLLRMRISLPDFLRHWLQQWR